MRDQESESVFEQETAEKLRARNRRLRGRLDNGVVLAWSWCCETSSAWVHVTASRAIGDVFDVSAMTTTAPIGPGRRTRPKSTCPGDDADWSRTQKTSREHLPLFDADVEFLGAISSRKRDIIVPSAPPPESWHEQHKRLISLVFLVCNIFICVIEYVPSDCFY